MSDQLEHPALVRIAASMTAFGAAVARAGVAAASVADSLRQLARALTRCARCGRRDANPRRLEPGLCDACNETRFWLTAGAVLVAIAVIAASTLILGAHP